MPRRFREERANRNISDGFRSYAVGRFSATAGVKMRGPGNLGGNTEGPQTTHAPHIDSCICTSVNQLCNF